MKLIPLRPIRDELWCWHVEVVVVSDEKCYGEEIKVVIALFLQPLPDILAVYFPLDDTTLLKQAEIIRFSVKSVLPVGTCLGPLIRIRRREIRVKPWRWVGRILRRRRSTSPSWMRRDTRALSRTWSAERRRLIWQCWWGWRWIYDNVMW